MNKPCSNSRLVGSPKPESRLRDNYYYYYYFKKSVSSYFCSGMKPLGRINFYSPCVLETQPNCPEKGEIRVLKMHLNCRDGWAVDALAAGLAPAP